MYKIQKIVGNNSNCATEQFLLAICNFFQASRIKNQLLFGYIYLLDGNITESIWRVQSLLILALSL